MNDLIFKEFCLLKKQSRQSIISIFLIVALSYYYIYKKLPTTYVTFNLPILACMILSVQLINNSIMSEKKNKTFEKMLTVYSIEELVFSKIACIGCCMSVFGIIYNIIIKIIMDKFLGYEVEYGNILIELIIMFMIIWGSIATFADIYILCNNQGLLSFISIAISLLLSMVSISMQVGEFKLWYLIIGVISVIVLINIEIKILKMVNVDYIIKD